MKNWRTLCENFILERDEAIHKRIVEDSENPQSFLEEADDAFVTDKDGDTDHLDTSGAATVDDIMDKAGDGADKVTVGDFSIQRATDQQKAGEDEEADSDINDPHAIDKPLDQTQ
jgi:hypothetical protein